LTKDTMLCGEDPFLFKRKWRWGESDDEKRLNDVLRCCEQMTTHSQRAIRGKYVLTSSAHTHTPHVTRHTSHCLLRISSHLSSFRMGTLVLLPQSHSLPINTDFTTCVAMCGSGLPPPLHQQVLCTPSHSHSLSSLTLRLPLSLSLSLSLSLRFFRRFLGCFTVQKERFRRFSVAFKKEDLISAHPTAAIAIDQVFGRHGREESGERGIS
jgi:hypothetical protein